MSKAEKFIDDCTRNCSNELCAVEDKFRKKVISYHEWLTPDQARRAVEIAREEMLNEICEWLEEHKDMSDYTWYDEIEHESGITAKCITDLKQAMKDE